MSSRARFVVVGAGMAGARAAQTLREEGFDGAVVLLGDEPVRPYDRVPLSKQYLRGEPGGHRLFVHDEGYYAAQQIELRTGAPVAELDVADRRVTLASGERIGYDALLLTTGAEPRRLHVPGSDLAGICRLRSLADADRLRDTLRDAERVAVIGAGWIGCEVAASARQLGTEVALIGRQPLPLQNALGEEVAGFFREVHAEHGVEFHLDCAVESIRGTTAVEEVVLSNGQVVAADAVVVGIGAQPRIGLAEAAGLAVHNGIVTDERMATSVPGVFAAGDVANAWHPGLRRRLRLEHWSAALNQGPAAARSMMGQALAYQRVPFFFSDQYDISMEYSGDATDADQFVVRHLPGERQFIAFWLRQGRVAAGMNVNVRGVADVIAALVAGRRALDPAALADADLDLAGLVRPAR